MVHLIRFHGVLAPNAKLHPAILFHERRKRRGEHERGEQQETDDEYHTERQECLATRSGVQDHPKPCSMSSRDMVAMRLASDSLASPSSTCSVIQCVPA